MTIDEAIKLIQADIDDPNVDWDCPLGHAYKLSLEALKREKNNRDHRIPGWNRPLPGETEA